MFLDQGTVVGLSFFAGWLSRHFVTKVQRRSRNEEQRRDLVWMGGPPDLVRHNVYAFGPWPTREQVVSYAHIGDIIVAKDEDGNLIRAEKQCPGGQWRRCCPHGHTDSDNCPVCCH